MILALFSHRRNQVQDSCDYAPLTVKQFWEHIFDIHIFIDTPQCALWGTTQSSLWQKTCCPAAPSATDRQPQWSTLQGCLSYTGPGWLHRSYPESLPWGAGQLGQALDNPEGHPIHLSSAQGWQELPWGLHQSWPLPPPHPASFSSLTQRSVSRMLPNKPPE